MTGGKAGPIFSRRRLKTEAAGIFPELIGGEENAPANRSSAGLADFPRMPPKGKPGATAAAFPIIQTRTN
jgi:hypothetical protein